MKKTFACGHTGLGAFCHRCAQEARRREEAQRQLEALSQARAKVRALEDSDVIDLAGLPANVAAAARKLLTKIAAGGHWKTLGGIRFQVNTQYVRFRLPAQYRLICRLVDGHVTPVEAMSHETYNQRWKKL